MAELSQTTAHAHAEGTRAGDAPRATWERGKSQVLEKAHASRFISFITQSRGCGEAALTPEGFSLPRGLGKHFSALKLVFELGQYYATSAHKQLPFPSLPREQLTCGSMIDAGAAQGQVLGFICTSSGPPCHGSMAWSAAPWGSQKPERDMYHHRHSSISTVPKPPCLCLSRGCTHLLLSTARQGCWRDLKDL